MAPPSPIPPYYTPTAAALPEPDPSTATYFTPDEPTFPAELEPLLPPLSPPTLPVDPIPDNIPSTAPEIVALSATPLPTVSVEIIVPRSTSPNRLDSPDPEILSTAQALGQTLTDQLYTHHGCYIYCHRQRETRHSTQHTDHPDVLRVPTMARREDHLARQVSKPSHADPVHVCLATDHRSDTVTEVTFDIDSIVGFASSLAVAKQGVRWNPTQMAMSDLQSSLHLDPLPVQYLDPQGRSHRALRAVHEIPHYTFGRLTGFEDISLILLFPRLYRKEQQSSRLRDQEFQIWMDQVLLPAIYRHHDGSLVQHYPSSFEHSRLNGTARGVEPGRSGSSLRRGSSSYVIFSRLICCRILASILGTVQQPGQQQFQDIAILLQGKNLKTLTKAPTWEGMVQLFQRHCDCHRAIFYAGPRTALWRRYCLESYSEWIQQQQPRGSPPPRVQFYPTSLLQDTGSLTLETRRTAPQRQAGLLYNQFYSSVKEVFAAGNVYPFTNPALETLALDPQLRKTWQHVGGGLSHDPVALTRAYLHMKRRCHAALQGSSQKIFGLREEHRVSWDLFRAIHTAMRGRYLHRTRIPGTPGAEAPFYSFPTPTLLSWLYWNTNKFCVGFEMIYSLNDRHFVTWEHTRAVYRARYAQVRDVRQDFLRINQIHRWMEEFSAVPRCLELLEDLLQQLCLCIFRKDVFTHVQHLLRPEHVARTLAGEVPLCWSSVGPILIESAQPPVLLQGNRVAVKSIDTLYAWLWEWKDGQYDRHGWKDKPYRMVYRQGYEIIQQIRGQAQARAWKQAVRTAFIQSHWLLPYPHDRGFMRKCKESGQEVWWSSYHGGLNRYYRRYYPPERELPAGYYRHHPTQLRQHGRGPTAYMEYTVAPEMTLVGLPEGKLYDRLRQISAETSCHPPRGTAPHRRPAAAVFELLGADEDDILPSTLAAAVSIAVSLPRPPPRTRRR
ncbi:hypothetical protein BDV35DRAFT_386193 [Aspergillus flavus]|uniref:Uncharacterized protein n=1 Tax=Aspergillus flavus TaxID=5059 RepID=A0A5N6GDD0_ASPFL|nr:hypothetical protein BDV35DRAFT_386193 [Aspergillus flavus]